MAYVMRRPAAAKRELGFAFTPTPRRARGARREGRLSAEGFDLIAVLYDRADLDLLAGRRETPRLTLAQIGSALGPSSSNAAVKKLVQRLSRKPERWFSYRVEPAGRSRVYVFQLHPDEPGVSLHCGDGTAVGERDRDADADRGVPASEGVPVSVPASGGRVSSHSRGEKPDGERDFAAGAGGSVPSSHGRLSAGVSPHRPSVSPNPAAGEPVVERDPGVVSSNRVPASQRTPRTPDTPHVEGDDHLLGSGTSAGGVEAETEAFIAKLAQVRAANEKPPWTELAEHATAKPLPDHEQAFLDEFIATFDAVEVPRCGDPEVAG